MALTSSSALFGLSILVSFVIGPGHALAATGNEPPPPVIIPAKALDEPRIGDGTETVRQFLFRKGTQGRPGLVIDPSPEGKRIERVIAVPLDVIHPEDAWPGFLNRVHITTQPDVVERELLFGEGDTWTAARIEETRRNLRANVFVNAVDIFPCKGSTPDSLVALVVVKDFWSLRTAMTYQFVGSQLIYLDMTAGEFNFRGRKQKLAANFGLDTSTLLWGQEFEEPRAWGSRILVRERADLLFNKSNGASEGHIVSLGIEQPLYSLDTPWGFSASLDSRRDIFRMMSQLDPVLYRATSTGESLPFDYRRETIDARISVTRSLGRELKRDLSAGWRAAVHRYSMNSSTAAFKQATLDEFASLYLPRTEDWGALFVNYRVHTPEFRQLTNVERFGVTEDLKVGPNLVLEQRFASPLFGFSSTFAESLADLSWTFEGADNYFTFGVNGSVRFQPELGGASPWINRMATLRVRNVSPRIGFLRLIASARLTRREQDNSRAIDTLGGSTALRGFPVNFLYGNQSWGVNTEIRTTPVVIRSVYIGGAAFLDLGDASDIANMTTHAAAGIGIRLMTPQFARSVMRLDFAFPLETLPAGYSPTYFSAQLAQAFF